ncbi:MAG: ATP-binding cassette domain-containing protein [Actinobacteria bacterium]|nr:ATP-binding cassette domain-containing protein [Actinomycetota bacterium]
MSERSRISTDDARSRAGTSTGAVSVFLRWYRPYVRGHRVAFLIGGAASLIVLFCQALIPLVVERLLHHGEWEWKLVCGLVALIIGQLVFKYGVAIGAHYLTSLSATDLRIRIFDRTLDTEAFHQHSLRRASIVTRIANDVDDVAAAFQLTLASGLPGVVRVIQSLILLTIVEWRAGLAMTLTTLLFVVYRRFIGRSLFLADRRRLASSSDLRANVDEALAASRTASGLHLEDWLRRRFIGAAHDLQETTEVQENNVTRLELGGNATGLFGLLVVVLFALLVGGSGLAHVAAAILFVEGVVAGLEALPPWLRAVQLGVASQVRIDSILDLPDRLDSTDRSTVLGVPSGIELDDLSAHFESGQRIDSVSLTIPPGRLIGIVTPVGTHPDDFLALVAGDDNPQSGSVRIDGLDARMPGVNRRIAFVPAGGAGFGDPPIDQFLAVDPTITADGAAALLEAVGLHRFARDRRMIIEPLGHGALALSMNERQRLALAIALAARPRILLVGPLDVFADSDAALPIVAHLRSSGIETVIVGVRTSDLAEAVDEMLFLAEDTVYFGSHHALLENVDSYSHLWKQRLSLTEVDLSVIGIAEDEQAELHTRLVTERYRAGEVIYLEGDEADRIVFTISGRVEITATDVHGQSRRVAVLGPGDYCGDLRLTVGERRAETARALDDCVVRTLSREAISAGLAGMLERTPTERRLLTSILREGAASEDQLAERLPGLGRGEISSALALLMRDGAIVQHDGDYSLAHIRTTHRRADSILDRLGEL